MRRYLAEFLSDPRMLDINPIGRWLLLNLIILPTRPRKSAEAYEQVWTEEGSPLIVAGKGLAKGVADKLGADFHVELAMRYGSPDIPSALRRMQDMNIERLILAPLFPQYSSAATGSAMEGVFEVLAKEWNVPAIETIPPFYDHPDFIESFRQVAAPILEDFKPDHVLFSYHGLPERHVLKSNPPDSPCVKESTCCDVITDKNRNCYRAQCAATTRHLVTALGLTADNHTMTFQSRLGRTPWIKPYTDIVLPELAKKGVKRLAVVCARHSSPTAWKPWKKSACARPKTGKKPAAKPFSWSRH